MIRLSVGPANMSMPIRPKRMRLASATNWLPGPTRMSALGSPKRPKAMAAIPCTPPIGQDGVGTAEVGRVDDRGVDAGLGARRRAGGDVAAARHLGGRQRH